MSATVLLLFSVFGWMDTGVRSQEGLWAVRYGFSSPKLAPLNEHGHSIGVGTVYGATWTILQVIHN